MEVWRDLLRGFPEAVICIALLFFGSGMIDKADEVPLELQAGLAYAGPIMMLVGGIGLIVILPHAIYRLYKGKVRSA